jgi:putative ABC transport system ATP-binding protein
MAWWSRRERRAEAGEAVVDPNQPVIRLEAVTKLFKGDADDDTRALDNVTVDIARGEYVSVSGPSGCGKTTFLAILALLDTPTSGRYWLNGRATDQLTPSERARVRNLDVGLIFQSFNLIGDMTVYENVEYPLTLRGISPAARKARVDAALDRVGLTARAKQRPGSLSGGHQQLVAVARAITGRPAILLADEPTGNLDSKTGVEIMALFARLHETGNTIILVTHEADVAAHAHRVIHIRDGGIEKDLATSRSASRPSGASELSPASPA